MSAPESFQSLVVGVTQTARQLAAAKSGPWLRIASIRPPSNVRTPLVAKMLVGVGHPVQSLSDVRRTDARRAEIDRPEGVARSFQVSVYKVEPSKSVFARNLLTKDDWRAALPDEVMECGP